MKRILFMTGHYGSGKTELALNLAVLNQVDYLIDLDIINPYFRSREFKGKLDQHLEIISSDLTNDEYTDLPYLSKKIYLPFHQVDKKAIYDLGGSDLGAKVMKQFGKEDLHDVDLFLVVNIFRPETSSVSSIINLIHQLEQQSGIKITGLINNSNLLKETTFADIKQGEDLLLDVSKQTAIPLVYTCVETSLNGDLEIFKSEVLNLKRYFVKPWRS